MALTDVELDAVPAVRGGHGTNVGVLRRRLPRRHSLPSPPPAPPPTLLAATTMTASTQAPLSALPLSPRPTGHLALLAFSLPAGRASTSPSPHLAGSDDDDRIDASISFHVAHRQAPLSPRPTRPLALSASSPPAGRASASPSPPPHRR
ncbi:Os07g0660601 [Oryza sativa Japonica Group]|uniref:Os07g0660601 protein n=1 Tax=Oryza sativa subsp. japonica TaxID=39947 RepID=C7J4J2_ORYSJ|nr:Os07g0660601 [Oryza sativa Japonica Group]|eukprot:NP_001175324.1 Os07g0660601 [Oryza sativa Japonica Group]